MPTRYHHPQMGPQTEDDLRGLITSLLGGRLGIEPESIDAGEQFSRYGLDSLNAIGLIADLAKALGRSLSPVLLWQHQTPGALARHDWREGGAGKLRIPR